MKKFLKKLCALTLAVTAAATVFVAPVSAGWVRLSDGNWRYEQAGGSYVRSRFQRIDGKWYMFNNTGNMMTGWYNMPNTKNWYYLQADGSAVIGDWVYDFGGWYYIGTNGIMVTGWQYIDGKWYYFMDGGRMSTGWQFIDDDWYYFNGAGAMQSSAWLFYQDNWYWLDAKGRMVTDCTQTIKGVEYTFDPAGILVEETTAAGKVYDAMTEAVLARHIGAKSAVANPYEMTLSELGDAYGIDTSGIASFKGEQAMMMTNCDMLLVAEARPGQVKAVKAELEKILESRIAQFEWYAVMGNAERCSAAKVVTRGDFAALIMVGVYDNETYDCAGDVSAAVKAFNKAAK